MSRPYLNALLITAMLACSSAAWADKGGKDHSKGHDKHHGKSGHHHDDDDDRDDRRPVVVIDNSDRVVIQRYIVDDYRHHCPPGLAKKHNGCLPPGQAKKRYVVGNRLPDAVVWQPVPQDVLVQLQPVPAGYQYVRVDQDVLLVSQASHHVIDAITLLSAVGR